MTPQSSPRDSAFVKELRKKRPHYIAFLKYLDGVRRTLSTTNAVDAINKQLEILRRNIGGYFHSEETTTLKLGIVVTSLESGKWHRVAATVMAAISSTPCRGAIRGGMIPAQPVSVSPKLRSYCRQDWSDSR